MKRSHGRGALTYSRKRPITNVPGVSRTNSFEMTLGKGIFRRDVTKAWAQTDEAAVDIKTDAITCAFSIKIASISWGILRSAARIEKY